MVAIGGAGAVVGGGVWGGCGGKVVVVSTAMHSNDLRHGDVHVTGWHCEKGEEARKSTTR